MERIGDMPGLLVFVFRFVRLLLSGHQTVAIENAALRMQIAAFQRKRKRPLLTTLDRVFWVILRTLWSDWRHPFLYVQADTVVRWQRERFRRFWAVVRQQSIRTKVAMPQYVCSRDGGLQCRVRRQVTAVTWPSLAVFNVQLTSQFHSPRH
jgi:hypothetical protein